MTEQKDINTQYYNFIKENNIEKCKQLINENPHLIRKNLEIESENVELYYEDAASLAFKMNNKEIVNFILNLHFKELQNFENGNYQNSQLISSIIHSNNEDYLKLIINHPQRELINWNNSIYNSSPLIEAINSNCSDEIIKALINMKVDPLKSTSNGDNAFTACATNGDIDIYNILNKENIINRENKKNIDIDIIINRAIQYNNSPIFDAIFKFGSKGLDHLFNLAVEFKTTRVLQAIILENDFIPGAQQLDDLTEIISYTYSSEEDTDSAIFLMNFLSTVKIKFEKFKNADNKNIWNLAIDNNNLLLIDKLLEIPEIINQRDHDGNSPLMYALERRMHLIADKILEHNPNVNLKNKQGDTALIFATKNNISYLVDPLIKLNSFTYEKNNKGQTPLFWAIKHQNFPMTAKLLWAGAPIATNSLTVQNTIVTGQISLTGAVQMDNRNMDELLLNNFKALVQIGFNLSAKSQAGLTFPMHFVVNNHIRNFSSILECNFDSNQQKDDGNTLLMEAIKQTNPLFVNLLVQRFGTEIDLSITNDLGENAVDIAIEKQNVNALWQILNKANNASEDMLEKALPLLLESLDYSSEQLFNLAQNFDISLDKIKTFNQEDMWFTAVRRQSIEDIKFLIVNFEEGPNFKHNNTNMERIEDLINSIKDKEFKDSAHHILSPRKKHKPK